MLENSWLDFISFISKCDASVFSPSRENLYFQNFYSTSEEMREVSEFLVRFTKGLNLRNLNESD